MIVERLQNYVPFVALATMDGQNTFGKKRGHEDDGEYIFIIICFVVISLRFVAVKR